MSVTAIVLSSKSYNRNWPGIEVLSCVQRIYTPAELHAARLNALKYVHTEHCFFLDDDDDLPADYQSVIEECIAANVPIAYTDEMINGKLRKSAEYLPDLHLKNNLLVHHLALYQTIHATDVASRLPRGEYAPEMMLHWMMCKRGCAYIPRVGYIWNRGPSGMSHWPSTSIAWMKSALWCQKK